MIAQNQYYSYNQGELPHGCQQCVRGEKLVVFVTGLCPRKCYFCPISDQKFSHDIAFANERLMVVENNLVEEADSMEALGAGLTGGDPLMKLERTANYIRQLKEKYGNSFHIHLYTSLNLVTKERLQELSQAGLDEIRFHLDLDSKALWKRLSLAKEFSWKIGIEVPVIPNKKKELMELIAFIQDKVDFLVLNELEIADNSQSQLSARGFTAKNQWSYAVKDSLETGLELFKFVQMNKFSLPVHLCTAKLKDAVQLANRLKREGQKIKRKLDIVTKEGALIRGAVYLPELAPGFSYRKKLAEAPVTKLLSQLRRLQQQIQQTIKLSNNELILDESKIRLLISAKNIRKYRGELKLFNVILAIVKEYPTADQLELEVTFI